MYNLGYLLCRTDNKVAIIYDDKEYTYADIDAFANRFASGLLNNGVKKGTRVAIMAENSPWFISAYLGILRIGAVAVLISTRLPHELVTYIEKNSEAVIELNDNNFNNYLSDKEFEPADTKETEIGRAHV